MTLYELITPSDEITFRAENDKIALMVALLLGDGKAGSVNTETQETLPSMVVFNSNATELVETFLESKMNTFLDANISAIAEAFLTFAYCSVEARSEYDTVCASITDPEALKTYKEKHEDRNRTSTYQWVKAAWEIGERLKARA